MKLSKKIECQNMKKLKKPIYVTQPVLPPLEELYPLLEDIWGSKWLTNMGKYHEEFEKALKEHLGVNHVSLLSNGTLALIIALKALKIKGEVITTPYSFIATTHALNWNGIKPVFVDIEPKYCNIDPDKITSAISSKTTAIMPVHVYGNPVNMNAIQEIADNHGLKVIYDAAHAFGVKYKKESILNTGNISVLSFHATKVFNTMEGGAIVCHDANLKSEIDFLRNFGFKDEVTVLGTGINAKMNEFQAALGLLQLRYIQESIKKRKKKSDKYRKGLENLDGIKYLKVDPDVDHNYAYFPVFINADKFGKSRDEVYLLLKEMNIHCRRYFYPLISQFPVYRHLESADPKHLPIAEKIAKQVLCLPVYPDLPSDIQTKIIEVFTK